LLPVPDDHAYLKRKGIKAHGAKLYRGDLVIRDMACDGALAFPLRDLEGTLHSLQFVAPTGDKRFLAGGRKNRCYFAIGKPETVVCVAEGFATGASIHEATGHAVAIAFDAGNLEPVAQAMRAKFPDLRLILCGDDDETGRAKATAAARAVGGLVAIPVFGDERPEGTKDFNDLARLHGAEAVKQAR